MKPTKILSFGLLFAFLIPTAALAQAFGEYGRALGGVTQRGGGSGGSIGGPSSMSRGGSGSSGLGEIGGRAFPSRLIVASKKAALYPRQDEESEKLAVLAQGETLIPMVQSNGGNDWFMVRTQKGLIGWVKASDIRVETSRK